VPEAIVVFHVDDLKEQEILIRIQGDDVLCFEENGSSGGDPRTVPDPVEAFVTAARLGMFPSPVALPWLSGAERMHREVDQTSRRQTSRIRLWNVDRGAFRVLVNLLLARTLERIEIATVRGSEGDRSSGIEWAGLRYPAPYRPLPFPVDYEMPDRSSRERFLQLAFSRNPDTEELERIYAGLDVWSRLPLLGGYPADDMKPGHSAAVADPAFLLDPGTVEVAFPDLFLCDDDCYAAVTNWAHTVHHSVCPVAGLFLR
jgi:hypothetical protein